MRWIFLFQKENFTSFVPYGFSGILFAVPFLLWEYSAFESLVVFVNETKNNTSIIKKSMWWSLIILTVLFLLMLIVFIGIVDWNNLRLRPFNWHSLRDIATPNVVASSLKIPYLVDVILIGVIISSISAFGNRILVQGRIPHAMAKDGILWSKLEKINPRFNTPVQALFFGSVLTSLILLIVPDFYQIAMLAFFPVLLPYAASFISIAILRSSYKDIERPFKMPFLKGFALIGFILITIVMYLGSWPWTMVNAFLFLFAYPLFFTIKRSCEFKRNLWFPVYVIGVMIISILGDEKFRYSNFTAFSPLGYLPLPFDLIVLGLFATAIFFWVYKINVRSVKEEQAVEIEAKK